MSNFIYADNAATTRLCDEAYGEGPGCVQQGDVGVRIEVKNIVVKITISDNTEVNIGYLM